MNLFNRRRDIETESCINPQSAIRNPQSAIRNPQSLLRRNLDPLAGAFGQDDSQHTSPQLCRDSIGVDILRELECPFEFAVSALQPVKIFALYIALPPPGAAQNQRVIHYLDIKLGERHSGDFGGQHETRRGFVYVYRRRPGGVRLLDAESARPFDHLGQLLLERREVVQKAIMFHMIWGMGSGEWGKRVS